MSIHSIGYGYTYTKKDKSKYNYKSTTVYQKLRDAFLDEIVMYVGDTFDDDRKDLIDLASKIFAICSKKRQAGETPDHYVLVFAETESLGNSPENAGDNASRIFSLGIDLVVLGHPEMSSCDLKGNRKFVLTDLKALDECVAAIAFSAMGKHGRKGAAIDTRFKTVYWAWQNYFIPTKEAIRLSKVSAATFYDLCERYRNGFSTIDIYNNDESRYMDSWLTKPVRGIELSDLYEKLIIACQRKYGDMWFTREVNDEFKNGKYVLGKDKYDPMEVIREKQKYLYGRGAFAKASKQFSWPPELVNRLETMLDNIDENFSITDALLIPIF